MQLTRLPHVFAESNSKSRLVSFASHVVAGPGLQLPIVVRPWISAFGWWIAMWMMMVVALSAWTPGTSNPSAAAGFVVNRNDRRDVLSFYHTIYGASENDAANLAWTGSVINGVPGTTGAAFKDDVRRRINFYRAMSGLPADIVFDAVKSAKCQEAALMSARNGQLSHFPPSSWIFYSANAAQAAAASNLALGSYGPSSIDAYMRDDGANNIVVGHRRWLHFSRAQSMGTGDVPAQSPYLAANAVWVIGDFKPAPQPSFVAWPNSGFIPATLVPARWSLSYPGANFGSATVTMTRGTSVIPTTIISRADNGYGDNTIVWEPAGVSTAITADTSYQVTVANISGAGIPTSHRYTVTLFDPNVLGEEVVVTGGNTVAASLGGRYRFQAVNQSDGYELQVSRVSSGAWLEGAEDPSAQISSATTGNYALRQTSVKRSGSRGFQLAFGSFADQNFTILRDIIPSATSVLQFHHLGRFATSTSTLHAEVSTDGGASWTSIWSRAGVGLNSTLFDPTFVGRSVSLSAYAGRIIRVRFTLRWNQASIVMATDSNSGFFIDDISVSNATELVAASNTPLAASATELSLNATTAGAALAAGSTYHLRVRPKVGTRWFPFGPSLVVGVQSTIGYGAWVASLYPAVTGGVAGDHDGDGISNGFEFAFGLDPTVWSAQTQVPRPMFSGQQWSVSFSIPGYVAGVSYGAQASENLTNWQTLTPSVVGLTRTYSGTTTGFRRWFFRHRMMIQP